MLRNTLYALAAAALAPVAAVADDAKYVKIVHVQTGKVLALEADSEQNEAAAVLADDTGAEARQWQVVKDGEFLKLVNRKSGKVLDVNDESTAEGGELIQWDDKADGNDNQRFQWVGDGKERRLKGKQSGLVLDVGEGYKVVQKKANDASKTQLWKVVEVAK